MQTTFEKNSLWCPSGMINVHWDIICVAYPLFQNIPFFDTVLVPDATIDDLVAASSLPYMDGRLFHNNNKIKLDILTF